MVVKVFQVAAAAVAVQLVLESQLLLEATAAQVDL
jgi:hypothetical protein